MQEESKAKQEVAFSNWPEAIPTTVWPAWLRAHVPVRLAHFWIALLLIVAALGLGRSAPSSVESQAQAIGALTGRWSFDLARWEIAAILEKLNSAAGASAADFTAEEEVALVIQYVDDANRLGQLEGEISKLLSLNTAGAAREVARRQEALADLRAVQQERRPLVEAIIQKQVSEALTAAGLGVAGTPFPPVWFTFVEPPKKLVVSPRDRIVTVYSRMLTEAIDPVQAEITETAIFETTGLRAYITAIGGLGAFPTMVVDRATLPWIFSTVAHEWTHNYLTLFPLGLRYNLSTDLITLNETVAEIVGDEIGERVIRRYYPEFIPLDPEPVPPSAEGGEILPEDRRPAPFDFNREMRETRIRVDRLLAAGLVEAAERYMEARRHYFIANGYPLRVLNQAYFAFHGSYGTSAASTSPLGPKLQTLREVTGDLPTFLQTVRWFTSSADVDRALNAINRAVFHPSPSGGL